MKKKSLSMLILSFFIMMGTAMFLASPSNEELISTSAENQLVGNPTVAWNNVDYSRNSGWEWVEDVDEMGVPQSGYCLLPLYESNISNSTYINQNLLIADLAGCNVGDYILINGVPSKDVEGVIIYCYPQNGFFIYVPHKSIAFSDQYEYLTIEVKEGMSIDGSTSLIETRYEYRGLLRSFGNWQINPEPIEKKSGEFARIDWNNKDYSFTIGEKWSGELNSYQSPKDGYCLLAFFKEEDKEYGESVIGDVTKTGRGVLGIGLNVDYKVKVNGVNIVDVEDAKCYIYPQFGLYFYLPHDSLTFNEDYFYPVIEIEDGLRFNNVVLKGITFEFRGDLGQPDRWMYIRDPSEYNHFEFKGVAGGWNNVAMDATHTQSIFQFGEYEDYLKNDKIASSVNLVDKYSDCGRKITINDVQIHEFEEAVVSYAHGLCYVYIALPTSALVPSNGHKVVTLHIEENTIFYDTMLPEVTLYLFNDQWITQKPETPLDSDSLNASSFKDTFGVETKTLSSSDSQLTGSKVCSIATFGLFLDYKLLSDNSAFSLYALGYKNQSGIKVDFNKNVISLYDSTERDVLLGSANLSPFNYDEWYSLLLYTRVVDGKLSIFVAIDDIIYIHVDNVQLSNTDNLGSTFSILLKSGSSSYKNAKLGADNKKPTITYSGKAVYGVLAGSEMIDFKNKIASYDKVDGDVSKLIQITWQDGAITNNKINKGTWKVTFTSKDKSNNVSTYVVTVIAADKLEVTVTFDGKNPVIYKIGDHISPVEEPSKIEDNKTYRFVGWYFNDRLWDFENDYVISDTNLTSKFQETIQQYVVSFMVEGISSGSFSLYFDLGASVNLSIFEKEGYTMKAYVGDEEVSNILVLSDMNVRLVYKSNNPDTPSSGCSGTIENSSLIISLIMAAGLILLVSLKEKGGKKHE